MTTRPVVIGVGNPSRRDDGVGWIVATAAGDLLGEAVDVECCDGEPARLLDAWAGRDLAVVVDAMCSGGEPGAVRLLDQRDVDGPPRGGLGSHALGVGQAAGLGRAVGRVPRHLVIVGIEGHDHRFGDGLSPAVAAAVDPVVDLVAGLILPVPAAHVRQVMGLARPCVPPGGLTVAARPGQASFTTVYQTRSATAWIRSAMRESRR